MTPPAVIDATAAHLGGIAEIYAEAVRGGPATFDLQAPPLAWWGAVLDSVDAAAGHLLLVAVDDEDQVLGYAKSGRFRPKAAYDSTCEISVYVADRARGAGIGTALYEELLGRLDRCGLRLAVAGVTVPNPGSARLHLGHGFHAVGTFTGVGVKFGRPWDVTWYERPLRGATLLDELGAAISTGDGARAEAAGRFAAALRRAGGHRRVDLYALEAAALTPLAGDGSSDTEGPARISIEPGTLATGRVQQLADGDRHVMAVPVLERPEGRVHGALAVELADGNGVGPLEQGLLARCADTALALWTHVADTRQAACAATGGAAGAATAAKSSSERARRSR